MKILLSDKTTGLKRNKQIDIGCKMSAEYRLADSFKLITKLIIIIETWVLLIIMINYINIINI